VAKRQTQVEKFKQAARELGTDDSEKRFNERLGKIARQKPGDSGRAKKATKKKA
jgi:hypothetical protein